MITILREAPWTGSWTGCRFLAYDFGMPSTVKGHVELLPSGNYRVRVYAGIDPVTGRERRLKRTVKTEAKAAQELANLPNAAEAGRTPDDSATMGLVLDRYLEVADLAVSTRMTHESYVRRIIRPVLGDVKIRKIGPDSLDALYAHLRRCSRLCGRLPRVEHYAVEAHECDQRCGPLRDHRTGRPHQCDERCRPHRCVPLAPASVGKVNAIISAALSLAVRYEWIDRNPAERATLPKVVKREPDPPTPRDAARLLNEVFAKDEEFGLFLWGAMTTGARRGEMLALREDRFDFEAQTVRFSANYLVKQGQHIEKSPKSGHGRVMSLDPLTCELFAGFIGRRRAASAAAGAEVPRTAFVFSPDPSGSVPWNPDTMTHRYERCAASVGITSSLKELRHYSATQLLSNGVDLRTVAGRLGHSEGSTTLKFYAQFVRPADQHAATIVSGHLADLRKKERLRVLFERQRLADGSLGIDAAAVALAPVVGLDLDTALRFLADLVDGGGSGN
jgi:integrase